MEEILDSNKEPKKKKSAFFNLKILTVWFAIIMCGLYFRVTHWPGEALFTIVGTGGLFAYTTAGFIFPSSRTLLNRIMFSLTLIWTGIMAYGGFVGIERFYNFNGLVFYLGVYVFFFVIYIVIAQNRDRLSKESE